MAALGIGPGAEVIIPGYMWIAIPTSILRLGAIPVLAEIACGIGIWKIPMMQEVC